MGNPLSPILADIVLEKLLLEKLNLLDFDLTLIYKYVDDMILALPENKIEDVKKIFESFNSSIKFTVEVEVDRKIPFLDMLLIRNENNTISTDWYKKSTASSRLLNFVSNHPFQMKRNVALSFIKRVFYLSDGSFREKNKKIVKEILLKNNYPLKMIQKLINTTLYEYKKKKHNDNSANNERIFYGTLPYVPKLSEKIQKTLSKESNVKIASKIVKTNQSNFTQLKEKVESDVKTGVVYEIPCECGKKYIGETSKNKTTNHST